jgi:hypothetical protein
LIGLGLRVLMRDLAALQVENPVAGEGAHRRLDAE